MNKPSACFKPHFKSDHSQISIVVDRSAGTCILRLSNRLPKPYERPTGGAISDYRVLHAQVNALAIKKREKHDLGGQSAGD